MHLTLTIEIYLSRCFIYCLTPASFSEIDVTWLELPTLTTIDKRSFSPKGRAAGRSARSRLWARKMCWRTTLRRRVFSRETFLLLAASVDSSQSSLQLFNRQRGFSLSWSLWAAATCSTTLQRCHGPNILCTHPDRPFPGVYCKILHSRDNTCSRVFARGGTWLYKWLMLLREAIPSQLCSFFKHCLNGPWPPPLPRFKCVCCKFFWTTFKKVRKRLSRQNSTK